MAAAKTEDVALTSILYPGEELGIWAALRAFYIITGLLQLIMGIVNFSLGTMGSSIFMLVLLLPYTNMKFKESTGFGVTRGLKIIIIFVLLAAQNPIIREVFGQVSGSLADMN